MAESLEKQMSNMSVSSEEGDPVSKEEAFKVTRGKFQKKVKKRHDQPYQDRCYDELRSLYQTTGAKDVVYVDLTNRFYGPKRWDYFNVPNKEIFKALQQHRKLDDWKNKTLDVWQCIGGSYEEYQLRPSSNDQIFLLRRDHDLPCTTNTTMTFVGPHYESTVTCLDEYANINGGDKTRAAVAGMMLDAILKSQAHQPDFRAKLSEQVRPTPRETIREKLAEGKEYLRKYAEESDRDAYEKGKKCFQDEFGEYGMRYFNELERKMDFFKQGLDSLKEGFRTDAQDVQKEGIEHLRKYFEEENKEGGDLETILRYSRECHQVEKARQAAVEFILMSQIAESPPPLGTQGKGGRTPGMDAYFRSALKQIVNSDGKFTFQDIYDHGIVTEKGGTQVGKNMANTKISDHALPRQSPYDILRADTKGLFRKIVDDMVEDEENEVRSSNVKRCLDSIDREEKKKAEEKEQKKKSERDKLTEEIRRELKEEQRKKEEERTKGKKKAN